MSQDVAALGFQVDSSQVDTATGKLDALNSVTQKVGRSAQLLTLQHAEHRAAVQQLSAATVKLNGDLGGTQSSLDALIRKLDQTRAGLNALRGDFGGFRDAQAQVEALGKQFGQTSTAMESYYRQAQTIGFTTPQTVDSLNRITEALQNQSLVGVQVRRVLQDYGVSLAGLGVKDADKVLSAFTEKMRTFADSAQKFRTAQLVLGPLDTDAYGKVNEPAYVAVDERRRRTLEANYTEYAGDRTRNAALNVRASDRTNAAYSDLGGRYDLGDSNGAGAAVGRFLSGQSRLVSSGLSSSDRDLLREKAGMSPSAPGQVGSRDDQVRMMQYLDANQKDPLAGRSRTIQSLMGDPDVQRQGLPGASAIQSLSTFYGSGKYSLNADEINSRYDADYNSDGFFAARGRMAGRRAQNLVGQYDPQKPIEDKRQQDPLQSMLADNNLGQRVAGYGYGDLENYQHAQDGLRSFHADQTDPSKADTDASKESQATLQGVYGYGEGTQRWTQTRNRLLRARNTAMTPGQDQLDSNAGQAFLLGTPLAGRGAAQSYLQFATKNGVDLDSAMKGGVGGSALTDQQRNSLGQIDAGSQSNRMTADKQEFDRQIDLQQRLTGAANQGSAAMEDITTQTNAYIGALKAGKTVKEADILQGNAQLSLDERRRTEAAAMMHQMDQANQFEANRITRVANGGQDVTSRMASSALQSSDNEYAAALEKNPQLTPEEWQRTTGRKFALSAIGGSADKTAGTSQQLRDATQLLSVAGQSAAVQAKAARDLETENQYAKERADAVVAYVNGQTHALEIVEKQVAAAKQLKDQLAQVNAEAKAFNLGRDANNAASDQNAITDLPRSQRARAKALQAADQFSRDNDLGGDSYDSMRDKLASQYGRDPELIRRLNSVEGARNADGSWKMSNDPNSHATGPMQVQPGTFAEMQKKYGFSGSVSDPEANTRAGILYYGDQLDASGGDARQAYYRYHDGPGVRSASNVAVSTADKMLAGYSSGRGGPEAVGAYRQGLGNADDAQLRSQRTDLQETGAIQARASAAGLGATRAGNTADAQLARIGGGIDEGDRLGGVKAAQQMKQVLADLQNQFAAAEAQTDKSTEANDRMAIAYAKGSKAVGELSDRMQVENEVRTMKISKMEQEGRLQQLADNRRSGQSAALATDLKSSSDGRQLDSTLVDMGPFASDKAIAREQARRQTEQTIATKYADLSPDQQDQKRADASANQDLKEQTQQVQLYRDAWTQTENAVTGSFNSLVINGTRGKSVLQELGNVAKSLAETLLKMAEKPLLDAGGNWLSSLLGGAAKLGGAGGGASPSAFDGPGMAALGGVWSGGTRMMATGGLIDRPTHFMANGGLNVAGEAGSEAIMPLRRMPNGALGIAGGGGGAGTSVQVHAPITINGGGGAVGSDGKMDPAVGKQLSDHVSEMVRQGVVATIAQEKMPGGSLY